MKAVPAGAVGHKQTAPRSGPKSVTPRHTVPPLHAFRGELAEAHGTAILPIPNEIPAMASPITV
jgi:hypothetical protein